MSVLLNSVLILQASACVMNNNYRRGNNMFPFKPTGQEEKPYVTESYAEMIKKMTTATTESEGAGGVANRYTIGTTLSRTAKRRTTPRRVSLEEDCDYLAYYCLKAYKTGKICGRTLYYNYQNFKNYCMLDYVNCMERYEVWQIVHMGECFNITLLAEYQHYEYHDDFFLDQTYVIQD